MLATKAPAAILEFIKQSGVLSRSQQLLDMANEVIARNKAPRTAIVLCVRTYHSM